MNSSLRFLSVLCIAAALQSEAQIIVEPMAPVSICGAPTLNIVYTAGGVFNGGNMFTVELSDGSGSFAAPTVIGSAAATGSGSISCSFPAGIQGGSGQAIRVVATDPAQIGDAYVLPISTVVPPNAGLSTAVTLCSNSAPVLLTSLLGGSPDPDGTWSGPSAVGGIFDPSTDPEGIYQYVVEANAPCMQATTALSITVVMEPNAGTGGSLTVCNSDAPFIMFAELAGSPQQGGSWMGPAGAVQPGIFSPSTSLPGCYVYTVAGSLPCANENAVLCISVNQSVDLGPDFTLTVCGSTPVDMQADLPAGGTWTTQGQPHSNIFTPGVDAPGLYRYTIPGVSPCTASVVDVTVVVVQPPNAGTGGSLTVCNSDAPFILFAELTGSPQQGGFWTSPDGAVMNGVFIPSTSPAGCYVYSVAGNLPCSNENAVLCISVNQTVDLGPDFTLSVCGSTPVDMQADLPAGGMWAYQGQPHSNIFTPGVDAPGLYRYTIPGVSPCTASMVDVTVILTQGPNAGNNATVTRCLSQGDVDLFAQLGGTPEGGGTWTDNSATGQLTGGTFAVAGMPSGSYLFTYTVPGGNCPDAQATVTVNLNAVCVMPPADPYPVE